MMKYVKLYLGFAIMAALFMVGEVCMDLIQPILMSRIVDQGVLGKTAMGIGNMSVIIHVGLQMMLCVIIGGLCGTLNNVFVNISGMRMGNDMRKDTFKKMMHLSFAQIDQLTTGSLITRITNDITQVQNFFSQFVRGMIRMFLLMFGSIYAMFALNKLFGEIVLIAFPFVVGTLAICLHTASPLFMTMQKQLDHVNNIMQEDISGIRMIKACVAELKEKQKFEEANKNLISTQLKVLLIFAMMTPVMNIIMDIAIAFILYLGHFSSAHASPGTIMAGITYTTQLLNGILMLVMLSQNISRGLTSWKRVKEILDLSPQMHDGKSKAAITHGEIVFKDVSFHYPHATRNVLSHINVTIQPDETIAIMGATGSGKSTFVHLIERFYDVSEGEILIDGVNVKDYSLTSLREKIAIVMQKNELFSDTIVANIAYGAAGRVDQDDIIKAATAAQAREFIDLLPNKQESLLAERGANLSGGQRQRLAIARALIRTAKILILDDASSALDLKTEERFYQALSQTQCTKIIVAQRIASARHADRIMLLDHGEIVGIGAHEELLQSNDLYQEIYASQLGADSHE